MTVQAYTSQLENTQAPKHAELIPHLSPRAKEASRHATSQRCQPSEEQLQSPITAHILSWISKNPLSIQGNHLPLPCPLRPYRLRHYYHSPDHTLADTPAPPQTARDSRKHPSAALLL